MLDIEKAWLAGFIEGEGTIGVQNHGSPYVQVGNTDYLLIQKASALMQSNIYVQTVASLNGRGPNVKATKDYYRTTVSSIRRSVTLLQQLLPYFVGNKRKTAEYIISRFIDRVNNPHNKVARVKRTCETCHEEFEVYPRELLSRPARFCSRECERPWRRDWAKDNAIHLRFPQYSSLRKLYFV